MDNVDNTNNAAPIIPAGTEPNLFGKKEAFRPKEEGQVVDVPTTDTKIEEKPQTNSTDASQTGVQESTYEELAAKKGFSSPDDLAKAYANLEIDATKKSMTISELINVKFGNEPEATPAPTPVQAPVQQDNYTQDDAVKIVQGLIDKSIKPLLEKQAVTETFKNPEDMQYAGDVAKIVKDNPNIPWDVALKSVKYDKGASALKEEGKQEAYNNIQNKQAVQANSVPVGTKEPMNAQRLQEIINDPNIPFQQVEKIMNEHKDKFSQ